MSESIAHTLHFFFGTPLGICITYLVSIIFIINPSFLLQLLYEIKKGRMARKSQYGYSPSSKHVHPYTDLSDGDITCLRLIGIAVFVILSVKLLVFTN